MRLYHAVTIKTLVLLGFLICLSLSGWPSLVQADEGYAMRMQSDQLVRWTGTPPNCATSDFFLIVNQTTQKTLACFTKADASAQAVIIGNLSAGNYYKVYDHPVYGIILEGVCDNGDCDIVQVLKAGKCFKITGGNGDIESVCDNGSHSYIGVGKLVKTIWIPASFFGGDGSYCLPSQSVVSGVQKDVFTCSVNAGAEIRTADGIGMDDAWDGLDVRVQVAYSDPDGSGTATASVAIQCRGDGEAWADSWSIGVPVNHTFTVANARQASARTAAITPAGNCTSKPRSLFLEWRMDNASWTAGSNTRFEGIWLSYRVDSANSFSW